MGYFNRDSRENRSGGGRSFGNRSFGGNRGGARPQMHDAVCSSCGKATQLPFKPTGERPVYCRECFAKNGAADRSFERNDAPQRPAPRQFDAPRNESPRNDQLDAINAKLDKILRLLSESNTKVAAVVKEEVAQVVEDATPVVAEKKKRVSKKAAVAAE